MSQLPETSARQGWGERVLCLIGGLLFIATFTAIVAGMAARSFKLSGFEWSFEIAGIGFIWITFIGTAIAELRGENVCFDGLLKLMPARAQHAMTVLCAVLLAGVSGWLLYSALAVLKRSAWVPTPVLRWPTGITTLALISCAVILLLIAAIRLFKVFSGRGRVLGATR